MSTEASTDYARIAQAISYVHARAGSQPSLSELADHLQLSAPHVQRVFKRFAGISPKRYLQQLTVASAKARLRASGSVLDATFDAGLSSGGRLHDLFVSLDAMTPGEFATQRFEVTQGTADTPLGRCRVAWTARGICAVDFLDVGAEPNALPGVVVGVDDSGAHARATHLFDATPTPLHVRGTNWQTQVWRALLRIPEGYAVTYAGLARSLGRPTAARAVASAVARNPVAIWIPCHRVIRQGGTVSGYRWDPVRKHALLAREWATTALDAAPGPALRRAENR